MRSARVFSSSFVVLAASLGACSSDAPGPAAAPALEATAPLTVLGPTLQPCEADATVWAVAPASGSLRWTHCGTTGSIRILGIDTNRVYLFDDERRLTVLDRDDGRPVWTIVVPELNEAFHLAAVGASGGIAAGGIVVLDLGTAHVAIDALTGQRRWTESDVNLVVRAGSEEEVFLSSAYAGDGYADEFARVGGIALRARTTGELRWSGTMPTISGEPVIVADMVAVPQFPDGRPDLAIALDLTDGTERWRTSDGWLTARAVQPEDDPLRTGVILANRGDEVVAIEATDGARRWSVDARTPWGIWSVGTETVGLSSGTEVLAVGIDDGRIRWRRESTAIPLSAETGATGLVVANGASVEWWDETDGHTVWSAPLIPIDDHHRVDALAGGDLVVISNAAVGSLELAVEIPDGFVPPPTAPLED